MLAGDLEFDEEAWDAARIALHDARYLDGGQTVQVTAAQHIATGELCGFNELVIGPDLTRATHQEDTLVLTSIAVIGWACWSNAPGCSPGARWLRTPR